LGIVVIGVLVAAFTGVLVVGLLRGPWDDEPREKPSFGATETPSGPSTPSPASEPSSGPTEVPEPGSLETVDVSEVSVAPPVGLDQKGDFRTGVTLRITSIEAVNGVGRGPGEVSGPALRLTMEARNDSGDPVSLEGMVVDLRYGAPDTPGMPLTEPGAKPFEGELAPREQAAAVYVFAVPEESRRLVTVAASYTGSAPTLLFEGDALQAAR